MTTLFKDLSPPRHPGTILESITYINSCVALSHCENHEYKIIL